MARGQERAARGLEHAAERVLQRGRQRHLAKALLRKRGDLGRLVADERAEHAQAPALARQRALQRLRARPAGPGLERQACHWAHQRAGGKQASTHVQSSLPGN